MRFTSFSHLLASSAFIAYASADSCCWADVWAYESLLWLKWDEPAGVVRCGLNGPFPPGSKCSVENFKDSNGNIQALTNVTFGYDPQPFKFRIGINPNICDPLPKDKVITGWEGWGAYMFKGHELTSHYLASCTQDRSA